MGPVLARVGKLGPTSSLLTAALTPASPAGNQAQATEIAAATSGLPPMSLLCAGSENELRGSFGPLFFSCALSIASCPESDACSFGAFPSAEVQPRTGVPGAPGFGALGWQGAESRRRKPGT